MKISEAIPVINALLDHGHCPALIGPSGVGKTQMMSQISTDRGADLVDFRLIYRDPVDLRGLPVIDHATQTTRWMPCGEFRDNGRKKIIFLDEINNALQAVQAGAYQLIEEHRIGDIQLPPDTLFAAAMNRQSDKGVWNATPMPLRRRWFELHIAMAPEGKTLEAGVVDDWIQWALREGIGPEMISFIRNFPDVLYQDATKESLGCDPRGWTKLDSVLQAIPRPSLLEVAAGKVGRGPATQFVAHVTMMDKLPTIEEIIKNPSKVSVPKANEPAKLYATAALCAHHATKDNLDKIGQYLERIPVEYSTYAMKDAMERDWHRRQNSGAKDSLSLHPAFKSWVKTHGEMVGVTKK